VSGPAASPSAHAEPLTLTACTQPGRAIHTRSHPLRRHPRSLPPRHRRRARLPTDRARLRREGVVLVLDRRLQSRGL